VSRLESRLRGRCDAYEAEQGSHRLVSTESGRTYAKAEIPVSPHFFIVQGCPEQVFVYRDKVGLMIHFRNR